MNNILQLFSSYSSDSNFMPFLLIAAFLAGILASVSPCSLGILPLIIGYVGGYSNKNNKKLLVQMISFSLGLSTVLSIIGLICTLTGRAFISVLSPVVILIFASIIVILGLNLLQLIDINFPTFVKIMPKNTNGELFFTPFLVGVFFALAASPCSSPILAGILAVATISKNLLFSFLLLFLFALGQCIIIIVFALFTSALKNSKFLAKYSSILMKICGVIFILVGFAIYYAIFSNL